MSNRKSGLKYPGVIDLVIPSKDGLRVDLLVLDVGDIENPERRIDAFSEKLVSCANFVVDGQYREHAPKASAENVTVRLVCKTEPTQQMRGITAIKTSGPNEPEAFLKVSVENDLEFRTRISSELGAMPPSLFPAEAAKPWWKFW